MGACAIGFVQGIDFYQIIFAHTYYMYVSGAAGKLASCHPEPNAAGAKNTETAGRRAI